MNFSSIGVYHTAIDIQQQKVIVIGNVDPNNLVRKLNKTGKHAELWPEPIFQNPPSGGSGGGGRKKSKNKKKTNISSNSTEPQNPNDNSEQHQNSSSDEASSPEDHSGKPDQDRENEMEKPKGGAVTIIHNPTFNQNPPSQIVQVGGGGGGGGKKKKKKKKKNNSNNNNNGNINKGGNIGGSEGKEMTAQEMPVSATVSHGFIGGGVGGHMDAIGYPVGASAPHIPSYVVSYSEVQPSGSFGSSFHHPTEMGPPAGTAYSGGCFYPSVVVTTVPAGGGSYYMFSEENANACIVM